MFFILPSLLFFGAYSSLVFQQLVSTKFMVFKEKSYKILLSRKFYQFNNCWTKKKLY